MAVDRWTREQLIQTLALYCQLPFGHLDHRKAPVIALAESIHRTPSAVALKLANFASLDPEHMSRGIGGMPNTSALDREIWAEFYGKWEALASVVTIDSIEAPSDAPPLFRGDSTEAQAWVTQRRGQSFFRNAVMAGYDNRCCITEIASVALLRASHIIPWSHDAARRVDPTNGLCLNALHDAAFDRGLITLDEQFRVVLSERLREQMPRPAFDRHFGRYEGQPIHMPERYRPDTACLNHHRTAVFVGA